MEKGGGEKIRSHMGLNFLRAALSKRVAVLAAKKRLIFLFIVTGGGYLIESLGWF